MTLICGLPKKSPELPKFKFAPLSRINTDLRNHKSKNGRSIDAPPGSSTFQGLALFNSGNPGDFGNSGNLALRDRLQQVFRAGVIAEGFTHVDKEVLVAGCENKAAAELQWVFAEAVLFVAGRLGAAAGLHVVTAQQVQQGSVAQADSFICHALFVDQERELDAGFVAEEPSIAYVAQPYGRNVRAFLFEFFFECAQLRDMLAAKNSTVVAQKDHDSGAALPQRAQADCFAFGIGQRNSGEFAAIGLSHAGHSLAGRAALSSILTDTYIQGGRAAHEVLGFKF
jgi:hypothetical protein